MENSDLIYNVSTLKLLILKTDYNHEYSLRKWVLIKNVINKIKMAEDEKALEMKWLESCFNELLIYDRCS